MHLLLIDYIHVNVDTHRHTERKWNLIKLPVEAKDQLQIIFESL